MVENMRDDLDENMKDGLDVIGEVSQDPSIVGALTPEEMGHLQALRQRRGHVTMEIGNLEIQKARYLGTVADLETQGQELLESVGRRLGISDGDKFQVLPDGRVKVLVVPPQG